MSEDDEVIDWDAEAEARARRAISPETRRRNREAFLQRRADFNATPEGIARKAAREAESEFERETRFARDNDPAERAARTARAWEIHRAQQAEIRRVLDKVAEDRRRKEKLQKEMVAIEWNITPSKRRETIEMIWGGPLTHVNVEVLLKIRSSKGEKEKNAQSAILME